MSYVVVTQEQKSIIHSDKPLINVGYDYRDKALHTVAVLALESLHSNKKTIIYIPHEEEREQLKTILHFMGLDDVVLFVDLLSDISHDKGHFAKDKLSKEFSFDAIDHTLKRLNYNNIIHEKETFNNLKYKRKGAHETWREILDKYIQLPPHSHVKYLYNNLRKENIEMEVYTLDTTISLIEKAQNIYSKNFDFVATHYSNIGVRPALLTVFNIEDTLNFINETLIKAQNLKLKYHECQLDIIESLNDKDNNWLQNQKKLIQKIETILPVYATLKSSEKKGNFISELFHTKSSPSEKVEKTIVLLYENLHLNLKNRQLIHQDIPTDILKNIELQLDNIKTIMDKESNKFPSSNQEYLKHINRLNFTYNKLPQLENELFELFENINSEQVYNQKMEANSISFIKQMESLEALIKQLEKTSIGLEKNKSYIQWNNFLGELDTYHRALIHLLLSVPQEEWQNAFLSYYYFNQLYADLPKIVENNLFDVYSDYHDIEIQNRIAPHLDKRSEALGNLKKKASHLYNFLFKNQSSQESTSWKWILSQYTHSITAFYPIVIVDNEDISDLQNESFDTLVVFNAPEVNPNLLQICPQLITFWKNPTQGPMDFHLAAPYLLQDKITSVGVSQRYSLVQAITQTIISLNQRPRLFTLRNSSVISFTSSYIEQQLLSALHHSGIKEITTAENLTESLESVLLDSTENVFILMEDGTFVSDDVCPIIEQEHIKNNLQKAGCILLDISCLDLFKDAENTIEKLKADLLHHIQKNKRN